MFILRLFFILILVSSCSQASYYRSSYIPPRYQQSTVEAVTKTALGIGCLAAIGYGIYRFCDWLFTPSDEKVLQKGIDIAQYTHTHYDSIIGFMEFHYSVIPDNVHDQKRIIQTVNESLLYDFAITHKSNTAIDSFLVNMTNTIASLQSAHSCLADRIKKLRKNNEDLTMLNAMQQIDQEIIGLLCKLEFVHDYFTHHRNYFLLFELESRLLPAYDFELNALNAYQTNLANHSYLKEAVKASVMRQANARSGYAYMQYVDRVQADCNALGGAINSLSYHYPNRLGAASLFLQNLKTIHTTVVAEDAYHQELRDYKKEQLERQRLEAERAQAAAAAAQASALQQQAREMQRQNHLQAEQNRLNAERNAIMATQTIVNAINPQPHVNVYV